MAIVGAGIFGAALAYHLTQLGTRSVLLLDRGRVGGGATARSAGILSFQGWGRWDLDLVRESADEYRAISEEVGVGEYRETGGVRLARTEAGAEWLRRGYDVLRANATEASLVDPTELAALVPDVAGEEVLSALYTPRDATLDSVEVAEAYAWLANRAGAEVRPEAGEARGLARRAGGWVISTGAHDVEADRLVLACGAWTKALLRELVPAPPLAPFRTQSAVFRPCPLRSPIPTIHDLDLGTYVRSATLGRILAGDGTDPRESPPALAGGAADADFVGRTEGHLRELFPGLSRLTAEGAWSDHCVASPDRYPLVGEVPSHEGLFLATGFNGFGVMRAAALARRLALGLVEDTWDALRPAAPARLDWAGEPFDPRPEFPLEGSDAEVAQHEGATVAPPPPGPLPRGGLALRFRELRSPDELARTHLPPLSDWFDPFLPRFLLDALRVGGRVELAESDDRVQGVFLTTPAEGVGSVFTRSRAVAEHYLSECGPEGLYLDRPWSRTAERVEILGADLRDWSLRRPIRSRIRTAGAEDLAEVRRLMVEVAGPVDEAWFRTLPRTDELCFLAEVEGHVEGVSWASVVGPFARGHSFMVRPGYRGLGLGTDLLLARMLYLQRAGVHLVVSEVYDGNDASFTATDRAGMTRVGLMFHHRPGRSAGDPPRLTFAGPRTGDTSSPSSR